MTLWPGFLGWHGPTVDRVLNKKVRPLWAEMASQLNFSGEHSRRDPADGCWRSQFVTSNSEKMGIRRAPYAFTEQGVAMLSSVLNSQRAIQVNIQIMRIFVKFKRALETHKELSDKLGALEKHVKQHDHEIQTIFEAIRRLIAEPEKPKRKIGFHS